MHQSTTIMYPSMYRYTNMQEVVIVYCKEAKIILEIADRLEYKDKCGIRNILISLLGQGRIPIRVSDKPGSNVRSSVGRTTVKEVGTYLLKSSIFKSDGVVAER